MSLTARSLLFRLRFYRYCYCKSWNISPEKECTNKWIFHPNLCWNMITELQWHYIRLSSSGIYFYLVAIINAFGFCYAEKRFIWFIILEAETQGTWRMPVKTLLWIVVHHCRRQHGRSMLEKKRSRGEVGSQRVWRYQYCSVLTPLCSWLDITKAVIILSKGKHTQHPTIVAMVHDCVISVSLHCRLGLEHGQLCNTHSKLCTA